MDKNLDTTNRMIGKNVSLAPLTTLRVGGTAAYFHVVQSVDDIRTAIDTSHNVGLPIHILGGGSNTIFSDNVVNRVVLKMEIKGIEVHNDFIKIGAGEVWDDVVAWAVTNNYVGIEALSAIPGTAGAAPVQNIGAYGAEIKDVLYSVEVYDMHDDSFKVLYASDCHFSYRDSVFKKENNRYIICSITLQLEKCTPPIAPIPQYPDVKKWFADGARKNAAVGDVENVAVNTATLSEIREAIIVIRSRKLPDWHSQPNVGSFFKNPIIDEELAANLHDSFPDMPQFVETSTITSEPSRVKVPAGWLIEHVGFKGQFLCDERILVSPSNALVLINSGVEKGNPATSHDFDIAANVISEKVFSLFKIRLEMEPVRVR